MCYSYDNNGNLHQKTDNRNVSVQYSYDALNHLTTKVYANDPSKTPIACYQYGGSKEVQGFLAGRLKNSWTQYASSGQCTTAPASDLFLTLSTVTAYDQMGRIKNEQQCTPSNCTTTPYALALNYDLAGNLTSYSNAQGMTFSEAYDRAGRLQTLTSSSGNQQLFSAQAPSSKISCSDPNSLFAYNPSGGLSGAAFGNGVTVVRGYDNRLRTTCETDTSGTSTGAHSSGIITIKGLEQSK
jgi:YD repeat-containing protein